MNKVNCFQFFITSILTIVFLCLCAPIYTNINIFSSIIDTANNDTARIKFINNKNCGGGNLIKLFSLTENEKEKDNETSIPVITTNIDSNWQNKEIKFQINENGQIKIALSGPYQGKTKIVYPIIVDYKNFSINNNLIFCKTQSCWTNNPYYYKFSVRKDEIIKLTFQVKRHSFGYGDLHQFYNFNVLIFFSVFILSLFLSFLIAKYINGIFIRGGWPDALFMIIICIILSIPTRRISIDKNSEQERRTFASISSMFVNGNFNLQYGREFEAFFNDRFNKRDLFIKIYGEISKFNKVVRSNLAFFNKKSHWAFWNTIGASMCCKKDTRQFIALEKLHLFLKRNGIKFYFLIVPIKENIYLNNNDFVLRMQNHHDFIKVLKEKASFPVIFPYFELIEASKKDFVFFKLDHHWTEWGAYIAYKILLQEINKTFKIPFVKQKDYEIFYTKKVRAEFERNFSAGGTISLINGDFLDEQILDVDYKYYTPKNEISCESTNKPFYLKKYFKCKNRHQIKGMLIGTSMGENLLTFLPFSFSETLHLRLNCVQGISAQEEFKLLKRYKKDILTFNPDILILCIEESRLPELCNLVEN